LEKNQPEFFVPSERRSVERLRVLKLTARIHLTTKFPSQNPKYDLVGKVADDEVEDFIFS
jgi:hypothetical protein